MAEHLSRALLAAIVMAPLPTAAASAQELSREARMAQTIAQVCLESMRTARDLQAEDFGEQFVLEGVEDGVTRLRQARGEPWVRLRLNGSRPGACGASFSAAGITGDSYRAASHLAGLIAVDSHLRPVSVPGVRNAFTFRDTEEPFEHERHAYVGYLFAGGYHTFAFVPASPRVSGEGGPQSSP